MDISLAKPSALLLVGRDVVLKIHWDEIRMVECVVASNER